MIKDDRTFEEAVAYRDKMNKLGNNSQVEVMEDSITEKKQYIVFVW